MNKTELKLMRKLMFFSVAEAAEVISKTRARQWQRYEKGDAEIPEDVITRMHWFLELYYNILSDYEKEIERQIDSEGMAYIPASPADIKHGDVPRLAVERLHEAVVAHLKIYYLDELDIVETSQ